MDNQLWLDLDQVAPLIGAHRQDIYRAIRLGNFPFAHVRIGRKIKISARSLGLIPDRDGASQKQGSDENEAPNANQ